MLKNINKVLIVLPVVLNLSVVGDSFGQEIKKESKDFQWFGALSLIGGVYEQPFLEQATADAFFEPATQFESFISLDFELHIEWKGFFIEQPGQSQQRIDGQFSGFAGGFRFYSNEHWDIEALITEASGNFVSEFSTPTQTITFNRRTDTRVGLRANGFYDNYFLQIIWTPFSLHSEIGGNQLSASIRKDWQIRNVSLYTSVGALYRSSDILGFYFNLSDENSQLLEGVIGDVPGVAASIFAPFEASGGTVYSFQAGFEYPISEHWVAGGIVSHSRLTEAEAESPIGLFSDDSTVAAFSLTYVF